MIALPKVIKLNNGRQPPDIKALQFKFMFCAKMERSKIMINTVICFVAN